MSCRLHGPTCRVPWGYDPAHTDSSRPYTLDELAGRPHPPHRFAYPSAREYEQGFYLWRALRCDGRLTSAESRAKLEALADEMGVPREEIDA